MEKQHAIDLLDNLIGMVEDNQENDYDTAFRMAIDALKQPEIVRCGECEHYHDTIDKETGCPSGRYMCDLFDDEPPKDWYCADAERRTDK